MPTKGGIPPNRIIAALRARNAEAEAENETGLPGHLQDRSQEPVSEIELPPPASTASGDIGASLDTNALPPTIQGARAMLKNMGAVERLDGRLYFTFPKPAGILYEVPNVSVKAGLQLSKIRARLLDLHIDAAENGETESNVSALLDVCEDAAKLFKGLARPVSRAYRWLVYWLPFHNPFWHISAQELSDFLDFFSSCQILSRAQFHGIQSPPKARKSRSI